jgi:hypothetical protein
MARATDDLKRRMLTLLKEDEEFRYAVAGLIAWRRYSKDWIDMRRR